jgi:putative transposase
MVSSLRKFSSNEVASERLKIINYYKVYGEKTTKEAFGVGRKTIFVWQRKLNQNRGKLSSLIPFSTKPLMARRMLTDPRIVEYIAKLRQDHPRLGKEKIYPLLLHHCQNIGIPAIRESTIGKVIKRHKLFYQKQGRLYHNPASRFARRIKTKRLRVRYAPKHKELGHIQMDTILRFQDGIKYYFYTAIDAKGKFAFVLPFKTLTSQTDNGLEFLGLFDAYLQKQSVPHVFTYPRCPRINGVVERFNRTIQEDFIDYNLDTLYEPKIFSSKLADYLLFYNLVRPHKTLGNIPPIVYLSQKGGMSNNSVTYTLPTVK